MHTKRMGLNSTMEKNIIEMWECRISVWFTSHASHLTSSCVTSAIYWGCKHPMLTTRSGMWPQSLINTYITKLLQVLKIRMTEPATLQILDIAVFYRGYHHQNNRQGNLNKMYFSNKISILFYLKWVFLEAISPSSRCQKVWFLLRPLSLAYRDGCLLAVASPDLSFGHTHTCICISSY